MTPKPRLRNDRQRITASLTDRVAHLERVCARLRMGDMTATDEVTLAGDDEAMEALAVAPAPNGSRVAALMAGAGQNPLILGAVGNRAWQTWTPTWTNLDPAKATRVGSYLDMGAFVIARMAVTITDTTPITGTVSLTPPVELANYGVATLLGDIRSVDASNSFAATYGKVRVPAGANPSLQFVTSTAGGTHVGEATFNATIPFTWTTGDSFSFQIIAAKA